MSQPVTAQVTAEAIDMYRREGAVCIRGLLDATWLDVLRRSIDEALSSRASESNARDLAAEAGKTGRFHNESALWRLHPGFRQVVTDSPLAEAAAVLMGSERVWLYNDHLLVKEPGTDVPTPWHQDGTYFRVQGRQITSAWIGLDPVRRESGAVGFVKGSHATGKMYRPVAFVTGKTRASDSFDGEMPDVDADPGSFPTRFYDLEPGDVTFHHALTIHGSAGNTSARRRRGYAIRFCGDDARYADRPWTSYVIGAGLQDGAPLDGHPDFPCLWPHDARKARVHSESSRGLP